MQDSTTPPLRVIEQNGWRVAYDEFGQFDGRVAPTRLTATGANVRLKLVLDRWAVAGPAGTRLAMSGQPLGDPRPGRPGKLNLFCT